LNIEELADEEREMCLGELETGDRRQETGDRSKETGARRQEQGARTGERAGCCIFEKKLILVSEESGAGSQKFTSEARG
jgi:hypothetical protein